MKSRAIGPERNRPCISKDSFPFFPPTSGYLFTVLVYTMSLEFVIWEFLVLVVSPIEKDLLGHLGDFFQFNLILLRERINRFGVFGLAATIPSV